MYVVVLEERLRVVVAVDVDLGEGVEQRGLLQSERNLALKPRENELEPVALLDLVDKLLDGHRSRDRVEKSLDGPLVAVDIE